MNIDGKNSKIEPETKKYIDEFKAKKKRLHPWVTDWIMKNCIWYFISGLRKSRHNNLAEK